MYRFSSVLVFLLALFIAPASAQMVSSETASSAVMAYADAVAAGDPAGIDAVLAPEFQVLRANGVRHDREEYLSGFPASHAVTGQITVHNVRATGEAGSMVVTYDLELTEQIDGQPVQRLAPRLTVFRFLKGVWKVSAHANFAVPETE